MKRELKGSRTKPKRRLKGSRTKPKRELKGSRTRKRSRPGEDGIETKRMTPKFPALDQTTTAPTGTVPVTAPTGTAPTATLQMRMMMEMTTIKGTMPGPPGASSPNGRQLLSLDRPGPRLTRIWQHPTLRLPST